MTSSAKTVNRLLIQSLSDWEIRLFSSLIDGVHADFLNNLTQTELSRLPDNTDVIDTRLMEFLGYKIKDRQDKISQLRDLQADANLRVSRSSSEREKREHILWFAEKLGATPSDLRKDRKAFRRWFGLDTVQERLEKMVANLEYEIFFLLGRLSALVPIDIKEIKDPDSLQQRWKKLFPEEVLRPLLVYKGDTRIKTQAYRCIAQLLRVFPSQASDRVLNPNTLRLIYRSSLDNSEPVWVRLESLRSLAYLDKTAFIKALRQVMEQPASGDDIFLRRRAVFLLGETLTSFDDLLDLIHTISNDPSVYVRQALVSVIAKAFNKFSALYEREQLFSWIENLAIKDPAPQVRAKTLLEIPELALESQLQPISKLFERHFSLESDTFVLRVGLKAVSDTLNSLLEKVSGQEGLAFYSGVAPSLENLHQNASNLSVRRWAAMAREQMFVTVNPEARTLRDYLREHLQDLKPGRSRLVSRSTIGNPGDELLGRVLSVMSQDDFGYDLRPSIRGFRITRGDVFGFRFWRLIYEIFNPMPDKRQGFPHTVGRVSKAGLRAPSSICSELTETKVPGEPLYMASESGWRPYLPLVDHLLSICKNPFSAQPMKLFTAEGVTEVSPPKNLISRFLSFWKLTLRFPKYAHLRNWSEDSGTRPSDYITALEGIGFQCKHRAFLTDHENPSQDRSVSRFFPAAFAIDFAQSWNDFRDYFFSAYENSLYQLGVFASALLAFFAIRVIYVRWSIKRARKNFALSIGGWGTRGKSGVERLKAGLFESLGHGLVAKTTGCEAMFLHSYPFGRTREMFLYRPYDKATIWEHLSIMLLANRLKSKIFLWECMGLNPSFVKILQKQWSVDDYSTITNTYPDHEDIQGPAGINIPQAMGAFVPKNRVLLTSEQEMKPVLCAEAKKLNSKVVHVDWIDAGLLTQEVIERFPYEEHPNNIALVVALAQQLGVDPDFALKEMADRVVPDIGVLKVFPVASVDGRRLEFVNGMSANERFATLSNWVRMGFDNLSPDTNPGVIVSTVVNNRADRLSRSRMFASILVNDLSADRHFLVGSNLSGLMQYLNEAWEEFAKSIDFEQTEQHSATSPEDIVNSLARRLRVPLNKDQVLERLNAILQGLGVFVDRGALISFCSDKDSLTLKLKESGLESHVQDVQHHIDQQLSLLHEFEEIKSEISNSNTSQMKTIQSRFKALAHKWFIEKFVVIEDYHATGDQVIDRICKESPPGLLNRIMGIQNIKGTGLDFVYRWQAWEACHSACRKILDERTPELFDQGLRELLAFRDYGLLCEEMVRNTCNVAKQSPRVQTELAQASLSLIDSNLNKAMSDIQKQLMGSKKSGFLSRLIDGVEAFLDAGDAIRRRKTANKIYRDLATERISHERAALELKSLNRRQTGGWLAARLGIGGSL